MKTHKSAALHDQPDNDSPAQRKRMTVFRRKDATMLDHEIMPFTGMDVKMMAGFGRLVAATRTEDVPQVLVLFREPGDRGLSLSYAWFKSGYILPRHSHDADCVYYIIAGEVKMGSTRIAAGEGIFIPANDGYTFEVGPIGCELLEFRNATQFHIHFQGDDDAYFDRMIQLQVDKAASWKIEPRPSEVARAVTDC